MAATHYLVFFLVLQVLIASVKAATEQSGSVSVGTSETSTINLHVDFKTFPSAFAEIPTVFTWVRNGVVESGQFRTQVTNTDLTGFDVTITRYDVAAGWDGSPNLNWNAQVEDEVFSSEIGSSESATMSSRIVFTSPYDVPPQVNAWARGNPDYPDTFTVTADSVDVSGFEYTVRRIDSTNGWSQSITIYWNALEMPVSSYETSNVFGTSPVVTSYEIPSPVWVFTPALTETSADVFDIIGREIHFSTARQMLIENAQGRFPVSQTTAGRSTLELVLRGDSVYIDESINFQGLKKLKIYARKLVSNGGLLTLQAPAVCQTLDGTTCTHLGKAEEMKDGADGKSGISSPQVEIYLHDIEGNINIISQGSDGIKGESGGDGTQGQDNTWETAALTNSQSCDKGCGDLFGEKHYKGYAGPNGGNGFDARKSGSSGAGGKASSLTLYTENLSGYLSLEQRSGTGGNPTEHGYGGRGGYGGTGGCGRLCRAWLMCIIIICWPECTTDSSCGSDRGDPGLSGQPGMDGFVQYPPPSMGALGAVESPTMRQVQSVKSWFEADVELQDLIRRHGESLFQRNDNDEALDVFTFLLSITDEESAIHQEVSLRMSMIKEGFNYYGHTEQYAPDLDWSYLDARTASLLDAGKLFEDTYNSVMNEVQDIAMVSETMQSVITLAITNADRELANNEVELESAKKLYSKSLRQLERGMKSEMLQINVLVPLVIIQDQVQEMISGVSSLIGGIAGFVEGLVTLNPQDAFSGAMMVVNTLFGRPDCDAPTIKEASATLQERLDFGYEYEKTDPEELDFSTMDASAVPIIMYSDLAKNKEMLTKELECLFDNPDSDLAKNLERVINDFYRDAALRIALIDRIMNIDVQLKSILYNRALLAETQVTVDEAVNSAQDSIAMNVKLSFTDLLFNLYQEQENIIMRSLYELSKAYQFSCLWNFNALDKYSNFFSDKVMTSNLGSLEGMFQLQLIRQELEDQRGVFLNLVSSSAGPASHTYTAHWKFDNNTYPEVIETLQTDGQFTIQLEVDPNNVAIGGCEDCYNGRLISYYVELSGQDQPATVPTKIYVKVAHMGDSNFLTPLADGSKEVVLLEQTPENVDGGHVMSFDLSSPVASVQDPALTAEFLKPEHRFCENSDEFFGTKPCKSPYASYVVTVPRNDGLVCSLDPNEMVSGTNCQDLDFTKFDTISVYVKVKAWSDYPSQPNAASMTKLVAGLRR
ncbi:uncharacterized protein LOC143461922 [Clavelina lepadiformis]|uniref:uncharacterized protein LOC143461922 n=1 Tax=Clavelina lepadiformis TaxID=159417 RepID=UPI004041451B